MGVKELVEKVKAGTANVSRLPTLGELGRADAMPANEKYEYLKATGDLPQQQQPQAQQAPTPQSISKPVTSNSKQKDHLIQILVKQGMSPEQASRRADQMIQEMATRR